jgi:putative DNA primase/helicase
MSAADVHAFERAARNRQRVSDAAGVSTTRLRPIEIHELLSLDLPERVMLLAPVLPAQGLAMVYAPRGIGKTHLGLTMAYAVACGGDVFHWRAPGPAPVLYVDGEMPARTMQERVAALVKSGMPDPPPGNVQFLLADRHEDGLPDLGSEEGQAEIEAMLGGIRLLVLDNLSSLVRSGRENEADSWQPVQDFLLRLRRKGVSVLLIHHAGKGGQQRGTSRREDVLDTVISLRRPSDYQASEGARFEVHIEKARGVAGDAVSPFEAKLELRDGATQWTTRALADAEMLRVVALTEDGFTVREISTEARMSSGKVSKLQRLAFEAGMLAEKPKRGGRGGRRFGGGADDE